MAKAQRVALIGAPDTWTVTGADYLPVEPAEEFLQFLRDDLASPNTVKAYAAGLAAWWTLLEHTGTGWADFPTSLFGQHLAYLRTGDLPGVARIGAPGVWLSPAAVQQRAAAVCSLYRYHADAHGLVEPYRRLYGSTGKRGRSRYQPMLAGVAHGRERDRPIYTPRKGNRRTTPVLLPGQVRLVLDSCCVQGEDGWSGSLAALRDRLYFAVLAETGCRLGEGLSLKHCDFHIGAGGTPWIDFEPRQDHPHGARCKSANGRRVYVGDDLEALYAEYVWQLVEAGADLAVEDLDRHFVFVNLVGGERFAPMRPEMVHKRVRSATRKAQGRLPQEWTAHWLRHTHATALLLSGVQPHVVMRRLGHLDVQTTTGTYGWVTEDAELRSVAQWKNYVAGWKGLHDGAE